MTRLPAGRPASRKASAGKILSGHASPTGKGSAGKGAAAGPAFDEDAAARLPFSRPVAVAELPGRGLDVTVTPDAGEREALAGALGLVAIETLTGVFHLTREGRVAHVTGEVRAAFQQTCVVTLEAFPGSLHEAVDVRFSEDAQFPDDDEIELTEAALDAPEPIVGSRIDLGALTTEFLALSLDPYPRKPGVAFNYEERDGEEPSPFAALARLKSGPE